MPLATTAVPRDASKTKSEVYVQNVKIRAADSITPDSCARVAMVNYAIAGFSSCFKSNICTFVDVAGFAVLSRCSGVSSCADIVPDI